METRIQKKKSYWSCWVSSHAYQTWLGHKSFAAAIVEEILKVGLVFQIF